MVERLRLFLQILMAVVMSRLNPAKLMAQDLCSDVFGDAKGSKLCFGGPANVAKAIGTAADRMHKAGKSR